VPKAGTLTLLFTDLVGSTESLVALGEDRYDSVRDEHDVLVGGTIGAHHGEIVKHTGDGYMAVFSLAADAVAAAAEIQRLVWRRNEASQVALRVRIGISAGDVTERAGDYHGVAAVEAVRLCATAVGGQILASETVRSLVGSRGGHDFVALGEVDLKGLPPFAAVAVRWGEDAPVFAPSAGAKGSPIQGWRQGGLGGRMSEPDVRRVLCPTLIGRTQEVDALRNAIDEAEQSRGCTVLLLGEAGAGKSRLAHEVITDAVARGWTILSGRAVESATPAAFRPLAEALLSTLRTRGLPDDPELGPFRSALGRLVPEWSQLAVIDAQESIVVLAEGILRLLRLLSNHRGALLLLEDLQWADPETLAIVEYLADHLSSEPVLCVATVRSEEASAALALVRALRARRSGLVIELGHLAENEIGAIAEASLGDPLPPEACDALVQWTEGNPFLIEELLASWVAGGTLKRGPDGWIVGKTIEVAVPMSFLDTVRRRLALLGTSGHAVLGAAAVLGRRFDWTLLPAITASSEAAVLEVLRSAIDAQLIAPDSVGAGFMFRHALTRDAIFDTLLPPHRRMLCRTALDTIKSTHPGLSDEWCAVAAELADGADDSATAGALFLELGRRERDRGALSTAEAALVRARATLTGGTPAQVGPLLDSVERDLCEVLALAGKPDEADMVGVELLTRLAQRGAPAEDQAVVRLRLARGEVAAARWDAADDHLAAVAALSPEGRAPPIDAEREALLARVAIGREDIVLAQELAERALKQRVNEPALMCDALEVLGRCHRRSDLDAAEAALDRGWRIAWDHGLLLWQIRILLELGGVDLVRGNPITRLDEAARLAREAGALATACDANVQRAFWFFNQYRLDEMLEAARECEAVAARFRMGPLVCVANGVATLAHIIRQDPEEARRTREISQHLAPPGSSWEPGGEGAWYYSALESVLRDEPGRAREDLDQARLAMVHGGFASPFRGLWALLHSFVDEDSGAEVNAEIRVSFAGPLHLVQAFLEYGEAVAAGRSGDPAAAEALMIKADRQMEMSPWFHHVSRRLVAEAAIENGWGEPAVWLREALPFFEGEGHVHLARACRSLLTRLGDTSVRRRRSDDVPPELAAMGITRRELDVLELLAEGRPTRDIAARLYLSPKTVERHVANLGTKAGVAGRAPLIAFAARWATRTTN
jgi:class 3 adenylate cyclase/DNA-binding CsgD family transcriptional regulator